MNRKTKTLLILLAIILVLPVLRLVNTNAETTYPILVWDVEPPTFVGKEFVVKFTCFSDSNTTIHVEILLDNIDLEWTANAPFFVNQEVLINTEDQLAGTDHKIELVATDYSNRTKTLTKFFTIDSVDPIFNSINAFPMVEDKIIINKDTQLMVTWNISDDFFYEFHIYRSDNPSPLIRTPDKTGKWNYTYSSVYSAEFTIICIAIDKANNTAEKQFDISYVVEEGEFVPIESYQSALIQFSENQIKALYAFVILIGIAIIVAVIFFSVGYQKREDKS